MSASLIEVKRKFVFLALKPKSNVRALCREFNVSPHAAYKALKRYRTEGEFGLRDRSRRPHHSPEKCSKDTEKAVIELRTQHPAWGGRRIAAHLRQNSGTQVPAPSTITTVLARHGLINRRTEEQQSALRWLSDCVHKKLTVEDLPDAITCHPDLPALLRRLEKGRKNERIRAVAILASRRGLRATFTCNFLKISPLTYRKYVRLFNGGGTSRLFAPRVSKNRKFDRQSIKDALFNVLHQPPANFGLNRTTWRMSDLSQVLKQIGEPAGEDVIRRIVKEAGYRWRQARVVLTSSDPDFSEKLKQIQFILSRLRSDEAFFSIDEFGPFAIKAQPGRSLVGPHERRAVSQWQKSKGSLTITAALELSTNQVTHFYSPNKNTDEMIRMMEVLIEQYRDRRKIYLSWDAASWHVSKKLFQHIDAHNRAHEPGPLVETAPLPASAQFLNVIESIFSGMSRAVIQNSNYSSAEEARRAIDRYFQERNAYFRENPRRAGRKIWGEERTVAEFSTSNNCKDPRFR